MCTFLLVHQYAWITHCLNTSRTVPHTCRRTIIDSSAIAGTYAPPAVHDPMTTAIWGIPLEDIVAWLKNILKYENK